MFDFDARRLLSAGAHGPRPWARSSSSWTTAGSPAGTTTPAASATTSRTRKKLPEGVCGTGAGRDGARPRTSASGSSPRRSAPRAASIAAHPDWAITEPCREPASTAATSCCSTSRGRRCGTTSSTPSPGCWTRQSISYVKWDMNRQMAGVGGAFAHRYILGLYEVLHRIFDKRPEILFESCSSGGNRFDLGMLCFSPQIWCLGRHGPHRAAGHTEGAVVPLPAVHDGRARLGLSARSDAAAHAASIRALQSPASAAWATSWICASSRRWS